MQLSNYIIVAAIEIYVVLIAVGILLYFHARNQRKLILRQHEKLQHLLAKLRKLKLPSAPSLAAGSTYSTYINAQLSATKNRFLGLVPGSDITTAEVPDTSKEARALALRHQFLTAEEAATIKGDGPLQIDWSVFEQALSGLTKEASNSSAEELVTYKKRVENLEKFKQLFFDMEKQWQDAQKQASEYYNQLSMLAEGASNKEQFIDILEKYQTVYSELDGAFDYGRSGFEKATARLGEPPVKVNLNPHSAEEILKLRNVAADQHRIINQLQRKLEAAISAEEKAAVIVELQQQLQRQTRFVQESETCVKLLEEELSVATERANKQQQQLQMSTEVARENVRMKDTLQSFTLESKNLMASIVNLEKEKDNLTSELQQLQAQVSTTSPQKDAQASVTVHAEFLALQNQYVELEAKYLDLKLKK